MLNLPIVILLAWLAGALANWAADVLPGWCVAPAEDGAEEGSGPETVPEVPVQFSAPPTGPGRRAPVLWHYLTLPWYFFRAGHLCPHCGERRPWRAPAVEAAMIALFLSVTLRFAGRPWLVGILWLYAAFLLTVLVIDYEHHLVLNVMLAPAAVVALGLSLLSLAVPLPIVPAPLNALLGGLLGLGLFFLFALLSRGTLGAGDVKLAGVIGLMVGFPQAVAALLQGVLLAGLAAILLLVTRRAGRKSYMAYAPYLCLAALVALLRFR